jgi:hypothetical protein
LDETFFDQVELEELEVSGHRVQAPFRYLDWSSITAHFPAPVAKVQELLPSGKLVPAQLRPGTAVVTLIAMEYREMVDLEPYNEFAVAVPVLYEPGLNIPALPLLFPGWFKGFGLYVHHLPVTTEQARVGGVEIYGFPKFLAEISFEETGDSVRSQLTVEGTHVVTLEADKLPAKSRRMELAFYTVKEGKLLRTLVPIQGQIGSTSRGGGASYTLGDHPIAGELRALGLSETAVSRLYLAQVQSLLPLPHARLPL